MSEMISYGKKPSKVKADKQKIYYPSFSAPLEVFGKMPILGSSYRLEIICEVKEIRKSEDNRPTQITIEIKKGKLLSSSNKKSMKEFQDMDSKERQKYQEEQMEAK